MLNRRGLVTCAICAATGLIATAADAQAPPGLTRTTIRKTEYPGDRHVSILMIVEIAPNFLVERHTHPGVESSYITEGGGVLSVKGQPDRTVKAGEGFQIPPEVPHKLQNGGATTRLAITYIVEKDKPLASPAPE